jgi:hypothetical protein
MFGNIIKYIASFITTTKCKKENEQTSELKHTPTDVGEVKIIINNNNTTTDEDEDGGPIWF